MRSGLIASLSIAVAAVAGLVIGDDALPVALADKANGAITSDATRPTLAGNPVRDYLSSAERSRGLRNGLLPAGPRALLNTPGDRQGVVSGKGVSGREDIGGRRIR